MKSQAKRTSPILIVDDDAIFRQRLTQAITRRGHAVLEAGDATQALAHVQQSMPPRAVVDLRMPGTSGLELLRQMLAIDPDICVVVLTGYGSIATAKQAIQLGARDYLTKPADADQILASLVGQEIPVDDRAAAELVPSLARVEWEHIQLILKDCNGNISQAARVLGIHRRSLQRKLSKAPPSIP